MSDQENTLNLGDDEVDESDVFYPSESDNFPKGPYESFAAFSADFDKWRAETFQTFVKANGSNKVAESHQYALLSYRKIKFSCIHHGTYLPKVKGERVFTHSRANNCQKLGYSL